MPILFRPMIALTVAFPFVLSACGHAVPSPAPGGDTVRSGQQGRVKTLTVGISNDVDALSIMGSSTTSGGWQSLNELHSQGLVTADRDIQRPIARLATQVPAFENGGIELSPDGRMKTVYPLRHDVTWQDGKPFTAADMLFAFELNSDREMPFLNRDAIQEMQSIEAPDDYTFVIHWRGPYYQGDSVGLRALWPHPRHVLEESYRTADRQAFINLPYWTTDYLHLGPFRLTAFSPGEGITFSAYDGYFLGRPKVDRVVVRIHNDEPSLYAAVLADAIDVLMDNSLSADLGLLLKEEWDRSGKGVVHLGTGTTRFISPQFDPTIQTFAPALDARVRQALTYAIDRRAVSETVQRGHGEFIANSLLPPGDRLFEPTRDGFARYAFDQTRARNMLGQLGWNPGPDGMLVGPGGQRFQTSLWTTEGGDSEIAVIADYWRQIGVSAEQYIVPGAIVRDREARSRYPGFETSARGSGDSILSRVDSRVSAAPRNNYSGANRGHYINPRMDELIDRYRQSVSEPEQGQSIRAMSELMAEDLPLMLLYFNPTTPAARRGVNALGDFNGGAEASRLFGTFSRNAHEWDHSL
jgi:peptide/nickel transport system substrate-binding protein